MSDITRAEAIDIFKNMLDAWDNYYTIASSDKKKEAVKLAISSLETDEAYQLEYENRDCVEVVRCEDCVHWQLLKDSTIHYCMPTHRFTGSKEFCSSGKERTRKSMH